MCSATTSLSATRRAAAPVRSACATRERIRWCWGTSATPDTTTTSPWRRCFRRRRASAASRIASTSPRTASCRSPSTSVASVPNCPPCASGCASPGHRCSDRKEGVGGQPDRFYVTADSELSITEHFSGFGAELPALRKRLRKSGASVFDHFPEYSRDFRRKLRIASEQAMELFHQTVSMKSVGDLNDFVREHMLEPFDAAEWVDKLIAHFEDLTKAHDAVVLARNKLADLDPLVADCDAHDELSARLAALHGQRDVLRYFFAGLRARLHGERVAALAGALADAEGRRAGTEATLTALRAALGSLQLEQAGHGGAEIAEIERQLDDRCSWRDARRARRGRFDDYLGQAGQI